MPFPMPNLKIVEYKVDIIALGLRNLISTGLMPVNKAYVNFNLKSLLPVHKAAAVSNIQTQPGDKGPNPNIRTTMQFEVQMPSLSDFCPRMTCDVYDLMFISVAQPLLGTFTLEMGNHVQDMQKQ